MTSYCAYIRDHPEDEYNRLYHDLEYGFPLTQDSLLFERFVLEINQAGLSWITILRKKDNFHRAYRGFEIDKIAAFGSRDINRLLLDAGIVRNRLKINAAIENRAPHPSPTPRVWFVQRLVGCPAASLVRCLGQGV